MSAANNNNGLMQAFDFEECAVRALVRDGQPWFVAADVSRVLGLSNSRRACERLDADEKDVTLSDTPGGKQKTTIISESGLYTLILRCDDAIKPGTLAHRFRKWVTSEVLPTLRTQGAYAMVKKDHEREEAERLERVRDFVVRETRDVLWHSRRATEEGALRTKLPLSRVRAVHSLGRLRIDALRLLWDLETGGTKAGLSEDGTSVFTLPD
jgi:prophage antirepressor-like protein